MLAGQTVKNDHLTQAAVAFAMARAKRRFLPGYAWRAPSPA